MLPLLSSTYRNSFGFCGSNFPLQPRSLITFHASAQAITITSVDIPISAPIPIRPLFLCERISGYWELTCVVSFFYYRFADDAAYEFHTCLIGRCVCHFMAKHADDDCLPVFVSLTALICTHPPSGSLICLKSAAFCLPCATMLWYVTKSLVTQFIDLQDWRILRGSEWASDRNDRTAKVLIAASLTPHVGSCSRLHLLICFRLIPVVCSVGYECCSSVLRKLYCFGLLDLFCHARNCLLLRRAYNPTRPVPFGSLK